MDPAVLAVRGEDAAEFLQNQGTADVRGADGLCRYSLFLDHKGMVQSDARVLRLGEESFLLIRYAPDGDSLREKLERHIIADDVETEDLTGRYRLEVRESTPVERELSPGSFVRDGEAFLMTGRLWGAGTVERLVPREEPLDEAVRWVDEEAATLRRLRAGIPLVGVDLTAENTPLEGGLLSAISFEKGCYLGQEVVARQHRLGRSRKKLVRVESDSALRAGQVLELGGKEVGTVTSAAALEDGSWLGLAMVKSSTETGDLAEAMGWRLCEQLAES